MKQILTNINSVAKYESKLLVRSWFFMIYMAIAALLVVVGGLILSNMSAQFEHITSLIPYATTLILNIIQSLIIVFMSSDYLKRDKQLDTSEVFYVRPLSNAEYLFGKVLGTIKPFIILDIVVLGAMYVLSKYGFGLDCSIVDYISYLIIIIIPSLIFFVGVSTVLMLIIGNQAVTYIVMLGMSWLSLIYAGSYVDYIFDMFMTNIPLAKSDVLGISNMGLVFSGRLIYISIGIASMTLSVYLFKRLAGSYKLQRIFLMLSIALFAISGLQISNYVINAYRPERVAAQMIELNNEYSTYPRLEAIVYDIDVEQLPHTIKSKQLIRGKISKAGQELVFNLNGGMSVESVSLGSTQLDFEQKEHLIIVDLARTYNQDDELSLSFEYHGTIDEDQMYIDIPNKNSLYKSQMFGLLNFDKRVAYIEPEWLVLTPESGWYVRPGVTYSDTNANWRQEYFSQFNLKVKSLEGMIPVSQGTPVELSDNTYSFSPEEPLRALSLAISRYKRYHTTVGERDYALYLHESNIDHIKVFEPIVDTIPSIIDDVIGDFERDAEIEYSLPRLTIVDVPEQTFNYKRAWSSTQELGQPELLLLPGAGVSPMKNNGMSGYDVTANYLNTVKASTRNRRGGSQTSDYDMRCNVFRSIARQWNQVDVKSFSYSNSTGLSSEDNSNPHYLSSILFNSRYNIVSDSLSWGNQLMEMYYMSLSDLITKDASSRSVVGMSDVEQVLQMLQESGCDSYLSDVEYSKFITEIILTQGYMLFAEAMNKMGVDEFNLTLKELIESREYSNVDMSEFLDSVSMRSGCDVRKNITKVNKPFELPYYQMGGLKTESGYLYGEEIYCTEAVISNLSDVKGYVEVRYVSSEETIYTVVELEPKQIKRVVRHTTAIPQVSVNTMNSANIPQYISLGTAQVSNRMMPGGMMGMGGGMSSGNSLSIGGFSISVGSSGSGGGNSGGGSGPGGGGGGNSGGGGGMSGGGGGGMSGGGGGMSIGGSSSRGANQTVVQKTSYITPEGDYVLDQFNMVPAGEIIVDNEQSDLFTLSDAPTSGYLNTWIDQSIDTKMLYKSPTARTSYKWSLVSGQQFYGTSILSAWQIRKGDGSQFAEWKIPVQRGERYSISFSTTTPTEVMRSRTSRPGGNNQGGGQQRNNNNGRGGQANQDLSYDFTIDNGDGPDALKHDFSSSQSSRNTSMLWEWLGDYTAKADTIVVRLTNKSDIEKINADAVKATLINKSSGARR